MTPDHYDHITIAEATAIQKELKEHVLLKPLDKPVRTIAGADISFNRFSSTVYAGIVVLSFPGLEPLSRSLIKAEVHFPYVPGFLAFREIPPLLKAWQLLPQKPDVLVVDGHGIAHPRRMGIAAHFGALAKHPAIGCAKKKLFGNYREPEPVRGSSSPLYHGPEIIGQVVRTKNKVKPVFVSPGNLITMQESAELILQATRAYRLPEPTRMAHNTVNAFRKGELPEGFHPWETPGNLFGNG